MARWAAQWEASRTEDLPAMERLGEWLQRHPPAENEAAVLHGEYRLGNVLMHLAGQRIVAVLGSELTTLGHPLSDLGYLCLTNQLHPSEAGRAGSDFTALGIPTQDELIAV